MTRLVPRTVATLLALALSIVGNPLIGFAQEATPAAECVETTPEENEVLATMYWQEAVWGDQGVIAEIVAPDEVHHWGIAGTTEGFEAFAERWGLFIAAFPDMEFTVDLIAAEGDLVATYWTATGTHSGEWQGIAPTGREIDYNGVNIFRFECGLIAESWGEADHIGLRAQLGATDVPAFLATPATGEAAEMAAPAATPCADDTPEANLEVARRWTEDVWTGKELDAIDEIVAADTVHHGAAFPDVQGPEAIKEAVGRQLETFPDIDLVVDMAIADGDLVAVRWTGTGTNDGSYLGLEPTGEEVSFTGINVYRVSCGQVVESWSEMNALQILKQLSGGMAGATPAA